MTTGPSSIHRSPALDGALLKRLSSTTARRQPTADLADAAAKPQLTAALQPTRTPHIRPGAHRPALRPLYTDQPHLQDQLLGSTNPSAPTSQPTLDDDSAVKSETPAPLTPQQLLQGIKDNWGQANAQYDLNQDGVVGIADLLQLLGNWPSPTGETPSESPEPTVLDAAAPAPTSDSPTTIAPETDAEPIDAQRSEQQLQKPRSPEELLKGIRADWGTAGTEFDLTGDGIVGIADLLELIGNWTAYQEMYAGGTSPIRGPAQGEAPGTTQLSADVTSPLLQRPGATRQAAIDHIAQLFEDARSADANPADVRNSIAEMKLPANFEQALLARFAKLFPPGKTLNLVG